MTINAHETHLLGRPIVDWPPEGAEQDGAQAVYRLGLTWQDADEGQDWIDKFAAFLDSPQVEGTTGIVIGLWDPEFGGTPGSAQVVETLASARDRLPNLQAIFFGDITYEECEISWIQQTDVSPLLHAYPNLAYFRVRGAQGLRFGRLRHEQLKRLIVESGGLDPRTVREVAAADLPNLEHLELWLGTPDYGGDATVEDLEPILAGRVFPRLTTLALRDSEIADQIAQAVAQAPVLDRVRVLDLSLGTLTDEGAQALLASPAVARLARLDIHHHYCSDEMVEKLQDLGIEVDAGDAQTAEKYDDEVWRYVAVSE